MGSCDRVCPERENSGRWPLLGYEGSMAVGMCLLGCGWLVLALVNVFIGLKFVFYKRRFYRAHLYKIEL